MKKQLNKWQIVWKFGKELDRWESGWRSAAVGVVKLRSFPAEGIRLSKDNYQGFIFEWRYWLPFEAKP